MFSFSTYTNVLRNRVQFTRTCIRLAGGVDRLVHEADVPKDVLRRYANEAPKHKMAFKGKTLERMWAWYQLGKIKGRW